MLMISKSKEVISEINRLNGIVDKDSEYREVFEKLTGYLVDGNDEEYINILKNFDPKVCNNLRCDAREYTENPYNKNIKLDNIISENIKYELVTVPANMLTFVEFKDSRYENSFDMAVGMGYYSENVKVPVLRENDDIWMSPTLTEIRSIQKHIDRSKGHVCTIGLGIGYFVYMTGLKDEVNTITVIEKNSKIIDIFKEYILPQFPEHIKNKIEIIQGDLFDYYNKEFLDKFDYVFIDTWKDNTDGLDNFYIPMMERMLPQGNVGFWIEQDIISPVKYLLFVSIILESRGVPLRRVVSSHGTGQTKRILMKIEKYFQTENLIISSKRILNEVLNDITLIRKILSVKL